jgi:hypothetical protein
MLPREPRGIRRFGEEVACLSSRPPLSSVLVYYYTDTGAR